MKAIKPSLILLGIFMGIIIFLEVTFRARLLYFEFNLRDFFSMDMIRNLLFTLAYALFVVSFIKFFKPKKAKYLFIVFTLFFVGLYFSQDLYYLVSGGNFYSVAISGDLAAGLTFVYRIYQSLTLAHIIYFIPIALIVYLIKLDRKGKINLFNIRYKSYKQPFAFIIIAVAILFITVQTINTDKDEDDIFGFSDYDLYVEPVVPHTAMRKFGVITYARIDLKNAISPQEDEASFGDEDVEQFFNDRELHFDNSMSGVLKDKNLVMIMAESLDTYAIHPDFTPNLYRIMNSGWNFTNFYAPLYYRNTADTEFMVQTGYYPNRNVQLSMHSYSQNYFPNTLPRLFAKEEYISASYHNFSDHFYPREVFHPDVLGYEEFYGPDRLDMITPEDEERDGITGHYWHSDLEMFEKGLDKIIHEDQFLAYFLTVSGHLPYEDGRHDLAKEHLPIIDAIMVDNDMTDVPDSIRYYHAAQWELDRAVGYLLETLETEGILDDTVIMIFGDHYAYGLDQDVIWEYDNIKDESNPLNIHNVPFIMYNPSFEPETFDQYFSSVDIIPTIANLFDLDLEYNKVMGLDAFDSHLNTIIFSSVSFMTSAYYYDVEQDIFYLEEDVVSEEDERALIGQILYYNRINNYILDHDYFNSEGQSYLEIIGYRNRYK